MARKSSSRPVLLIDDSQEDTFLMKRLLLRTGISDPVVSVDGGEEAIAYLRAALQPDAVTAIPCVIFCDIKMPVQNGFDVLTWVRHQEALKSVPFIMLTGGDVPSDRERAQELGANHFFVKYPTSKELRQLLDSIDV